MSIDINTAIDGLVDHLATAVGIPATADPGTVIPPCVYVALPVVTGRTLGAVRLEVPLWLVAEAPGTKDAYAQLLTVLPDLMHAAAVDQAEPRPLELSGTTYPAYSITATLTVKEAS